MSRAVLTRAFADFRADDMPTWAAGLTYYAVLSLFPALLAMIALLGVFGQYPKTSDAVLRVVGELGPKSAVTTLRSTIEGVVKNSGGAGALLGVGLLGAIWSASGYVGAFYKAANKVFDVEETRGFKQLKPAQLAVTIVFLAVAVLAALVFVASGSVARSVFSVIGLGSTAVDVWAYAKFPVLAIIVIGMIAVLYWAAPNLQARRFRLISEGAAIGLLAVLIASALFGFYVANFGSYNKTYGTLAFVPLFLTWLWIANLALLFGAEVDAAMVAATRERSAAMSEEEETQVEESEEKDQPEDSGDHDMDSEEVDKIMKEVEENPPDRLEDWPQGTAKYRTIGGGDANESWEEGPTRHLGPSDVRYFEDGSVTVKGEKVDNPEDFKGDPIPGGPTDPDAPDDPSGLDKNETDGGDDDGESDD